MSGEASAIDPDRTPSPRSWWGWGTVDAAVSGTEADALVAKVRGFLSGHDFTDHRPPDPSGLTVAAPRVTAPDPLAHLVSTDVTDRLAHARGKAFRDVVRNLHGETDHLPDAVVRPRDEQDVVDVLDWCSTSGVAVIPYGGGSSVVGGVEPRFDGPAVSLDMAEMAGVVEVDRTSHSALVRAGTYGPALEDKLRLQDMTLRHYPQSFEFSTLGGWLATRAGGHFATLYTHIDDLTEAVRVVTPAGVAETRRLPGSGAGPAPDRLWIGSEGALGVITQAWMRIRPRPQWQQTVTVSFGTFDNAVTTTREIAQAGLYPANCRLLDPVEALLNAGISSAGGVLIVAFESADHPVDAWLKEATRIAMDHRGDVISVRRRDPEATGEATAPDTSGTWRSTFWRMPYQRDALARRSMIVETFETACTWDRFDDLHHAVTTAAEEAMAEVCGGGVVSCRFTHVYPGGPAPYYGIYAPGRWGSTVAQWDEIKAAVSAAIADQGGTITHHHAVGRDHRTWYDSQRPELFADVLRGAKRTLDPAGILNPGVLIDP